MTTNPPTPARYIMRKLSDIGVSDGAHTYAIYRVDGELHSHIASCTSLANAVMITMLLKDYQQRADEVDRWSKE